MTKQASQADSTIHEDQLLNFLVNTLTGAFGVTLGENAEIDPADIYEVLVGATVTVGDGLYDTKYDRVLWVSRIDRSGVTVEPATQYETEAQIGWPPGGRSRVVTTGTTFAPTEFVTLVDTGRFEVGP